MVGSSTTELRIYQNIEVKQSRDAYPNVSKRTAIRQIKRTDQKNPKVSLFLDRRKRKLKSKSPLRHFSRHPMNTTSARYMM